MKKIIYNIMYVCAAMLFAACSSEDEPARTPVASIRIDKTQLVINESMQIHFTGVADQVVIFTGDAGHEFQQYGSGDIKENTGVVVNKGFFTYSYATPGTFHVVVVASTYDTYLGAGQKSAKYEFDVMVKDDVNTIDRISFTSQAHNVYYGQAISDADFVFCLPTTEAGKAMNLKNRVLAFDIASDSAKVYVDDVLNTSKSKYNMAEDHSVRVVSHSGTPREYKLWNMIYPEFTSIAIGDVKGQLSRNVYYQDLLTYTFVGADSKSTLTETHDAGVEFLVNGAAPTGAIDYADPANVCTLVRTRPENPAVKAVTRVQFVFE